jgi:monoamine oxidase
MTEPRFARRTVLLGGLGVGTAAVLGLASCSADPGQDEAMDTSGEPATDPVPRPTAMVRSSWSEDPWSLGSYSYLPVGATPAARSTLAQPVADTIYFAGEALDANDPATVHGALASGTAAAALIAKATAGTERIVIVGAGVAGAAAAARLTTAGHQVTLVEARERTGGRTHTIRPERWPIPVELGASWVHDIEGSGLAGKLDELGVATVAFTYDDRILEADGRPARHDLLVDAQAAVQDAVVWAEDGTDVDLSLAGAIAASGVADRVDADLLAHFLRTEVVTEYGADPEDLSAWWGMAEGGEGDDALVTGGYDALVDHLLEGVEVRLEWPVTAISRTDGSATVLGPRGETLDAQRVVVTVPIGVLQAGAITFDPPLPTSHRDAIDAMAMGVLDKVWLRWDEPWWSEPAQQWTRVGGPDDHFVEWFNLASVTGAPVLLALVGGADARRWAGADDDAVVDAAVASLQHFRNAGW